MSAAGLDPWVAAALARLAERELPAPCALAWLATGVAGLRSRLTDVAAVPFAELDAPPPWRDAELVSGELGGARLWFVEPGTAASSRAQPAWHASLPCWLAAAAGARTFVVTAAGAALPRHAADDAPDTEPAFPAGSLVALRDHVNLSGGTPLLALGETRLGPLFPDQTTLHDGALRAAALREARALGLHADEAIAACTLGPALETPAERRFFAHAGAGVSVQGLADPLIAAAHAGLVGVALVAVAEVGERPVDLASLVATARAMSPGIEALVAALAPALAQRAEARSRELGA